MSILGGIVHALALVGVVTQASAQTSVRAQAPNAEVRLDTPQGSMAEVRPLNQGRLGSCFGYALSTMMEAALHSLYPTAKAHLSPLALTIAAKAFEYDQVPLPSREKIAQLPLLSRLSSGDIRPSWMRLKSEPICLKANFPDSFYSYEDYLFYNDPVSGLIDLYLKQYHRPESQEVRASGFLSILRSKGLKQKIDFAKLEKNFQAASEFDFLNGLRETLCEDGALPALDSQMELKTVALDRNATRTNTPLSLRDEGRKFLQNYFQSENSQPLGVTYCQQLIRDRKFIGVDPKLGLRRPCHLHISVLIGHKTYKGKHYYLLQNTWGKTCKDIPHCEASQNKYWIEEDSLLNNTVSLNYFELKR